ncbi:MAG: hypothetical protein WC975_15875 [Phycisphaerae bacterium]
MFMASGGAKCGFPAARGQFGDPAVRVRTDPVQHITEVGEGIDANVFATLSRYGIPLRRIFVLCGWN